MKLTSLSRKAQRQKAKVNESKVTAAHSVKAVASLKYPNATHPLRVLAFVLLSVSLLAVIAIVDIAMFVPLLPQEQFTEKR